MTAQQSVIAAPVLTEAVGGVLFISKLSDPTFAEVPSYANAQPGDVIELTTNTSTGNQWQGQIVLTSPSFPLRFAIPKGTFAQNVVSGATANLYYKITSPSGNSVNSPVLTVQLQP